MRRIIVHDCDLCQAAADLAMGRRQLELKERIDADNARIRAELRDRLDRLDDVDTDRALHWLADHAPDAVNDALNETGAPL